MSKRRKGSGKGTAVVHQEDMRRYCALGQHMFRKIEGVEFSGLFKAYWECSKCGMPRGRGGASVRKWVL